MSTKFIKESVKIPVYIACRKVILFEVSISYLPHNMKEYIELDLETESEDDRPKFMQLNGGVWINTVGNIKHGEGLVLKSVESSTGVDKA